MFTIVVGDRAVLNGLRPSQRRRRLFATDAVAQHQPLDLAVPRVRPPAARGLRERDARPRPAAGSPVSGRTTGRDRAARHSARDRRVQDAFQSSPRVRVAEDPIAHASAVEAPPSAPSTVSPKARATTAASTGVPGSTTSRAITSVSMTGTAAPRTGWPRWTCRWRSRR